jgi:phospholipid/cholesterol/gamma-HCH transport system permease protein
MISRNTPSADYFMISQDGIVLQNDWTVFTLPDIRRVLGERQLQDISLDMRKAGRIDTAGAWFIRENFGPPGKRWRMNKRQKALFQFLPDPGEATPPTTKANPLEKLFISCGKSTEKAIGFVYGILCFTGITAIRLLAAFLRPRRFRFPAIVRHIQETGIQALPIIGLLAILMSMVITYQASMQLQKFGADIFSIDLTVISMLREMGVLVTAIMVAGRSGSAFAAEIGVMKIRDEVDAMRTIGLDPIETLVLPRIIALLITLPLLAFVADIIGLVGGALMSEFYLGIALPQYIDRVDMVATPVMFFIGMIKAPVFAFLIAIICTYQGLSVSGSAESVGKLTTLAVVQSIFMVIMADAAFSILFSKVGI